MILHRPSLCFLSPHHRTPILQPFLFTPLIIHSARTNSSHRKSDMSEEDQELLEKISKISGKDWVVSQCLNVLRRTQVISTSTKSRQPLLNTLKVTFHHHGLGMDTLKLRQTAFTPPLGVRLAWPLTVGAEQAEWWQILTGTVPLS